MEKLKVYTTTWCPDCSSAKRALEENGIEFEDIDIEQEPQALEYVVSVMGKRVVPLIEFKGKHIDGNHFNREKFEEDLKKLIEN